MTRRRDITDEDIVALRVDRQGGVGLKQLARKYGISIGHTSKIVRGDAYKNLPGPRTISHNGPTCLAGHPWTEESTYTYPRPGGGTRRACRICRIANGRVRKQAGGT